MRVRVTQLLIGAFLLLLIFHPEFHFKKKVSPYGVLLIDRSRSMEGSKIKEVNSAFPLKTMEFGGGKPGTAIGEALLQAKESFEDASFILLYSDGTNTRGENPIEVAKRIGIPICCIYPEINAKVFGFLSVFAPESIDEGDSVVFTVHYRSPQSATIRMLCEGISEKKRIKGEGIEEFTLGLNPGKHNIEFTLEVKEDTIRRVNRSLYVRRKHKALVLAESLDWNYKFFKRYLEDLNWNVKGFWKTDGSLPSLSQYDIVYFSGIPKKIEARIREYVKKGGKVIIIDPFPESLDYLPIVAPHLITISGELPPSRYLKSGGVRSKAKSLNLMGENVGYLMQYGKGYVVQFTYLDLWKLALSGEGIYNRDLFGEVMEEFLTTLISSELNISYPDRLLEGEDLYIYCEPKEPDSFIWDGKNLPVLGDTIMIPTPEANLHHFQVVFPSSTLKGSVEVVRGLEDRVGIDTGMLYAIGEVSNGGKWKENFDKSRFGFKEREIWVNLRHNWFFLGILFGILFFDWYLWMKGK